jgi:hypothetical protein
MHHGAGWPHPEPSQQEFAAMLAAELRCRPGCSVFEEIDADYEGETVPRRVATELQHPYYPVDLTTQERNARGLITIWRDEQTTTRQHVENGADAEEVRREIAHLHETRESVWVDRIAAALKGEDDAGVFVLGSNHVDSMTEKLRAAGFEVEILHGDWEPRPEAGRAG